MVYMCHGVINCLIVGRKSVQVITNPEGFSAKKIINIHVVLHPSDLLTGVLNDSSGPQWDLGSGAMYL